MCILYIILYTYNIYVYIYYYIYTFVIYVKCMRPSNMPNEILYLP